MPRYVLGTELPVAIQEECKRRFIHRFTGENKPAWTNVNMPNGDEYPLQFADDADWLANTRFQVNKNGALRRQAFAQSKPTWPNNPELRKATA